MLRANLNRLFRRTWCTTKKPEGLIDHLSILPALPQYGFDSFLRVGFR
jgi:hypothetical protein